INVFNPGSSSESVRVQLRLPSGPLAPLSTRVAPGSTWSLETSAQTRIPKSEAYSAAVSASGGAGVVVGRTVLWPGATQGPKAGMALAVDGLSSTWPARRWVVPPPGTSGTLPVAGAAPGSLVLFNTSDTTETYTAAAPTASGVRTVATGTLGAGTAAVVQGAPLASVGLGQIVVQASGPMAVSEDGAPSGGAGVVTMPAIALAGPDD
ncbi:MAG TPA: hypothetical protein VEG62_05965, partial [Acidimicrobiales bacterium]|nr:hypothetical protein [Acidimicrobiales bacterium]